MITQEEITEKYHNCKCVLDNGELAILSFIINSNMIIVTLDSGCIVEINPMGKIIFNPYSINAKKIVKLILK
ncbi:MAG: hypothetical protein J7L15_05755, partial [Clostridiales bacterium]|nr:hypothetical protein [Clostridiales bacterium]